MMSGGNKRLEGTKAGQGLRSEKGSGLTLCGSVVLSLSSRVFSGPFLLSVRCRLSLQARSIGSLPLGKHATAQSIVIGLHPPVRSLGHAIGAGYALSLVLGSIRAEREVASLKIGLARTFRRQAMMISLVFTYRCVVSFAVTNDLTHPNNDPLATISKLFFYLIQLPLELAICWNHASTDYRTVVDAGAWGDHPRKARENGKKTRRWPTTFLKDTIASMLLRFRGQHRPPVSDSLSDIFPLTRTETPMQSQTSTFVSIDDGDIEKQSILSIPSTASRFGTLTSTDTYSIHIIEEIQKEQSLSVPSPSLVEDVRVWTPRRPILDW
jgi:hypothetical protein